MKKLTTFALILAAGILTGGAALAESPQALEIETRFYTAQLEQLSSVDVVSLVEDGAEGCADALLAEQGAVGSKFRQMADDGTITREEFDLSNMMLDHADKNINGHCAHPR